MAVVGEDFANSPASHRIHRNAVNKAIALVQSPLVEFQTCHKGVMGLRDHRDLFGIENLLYGGGSDLPDVAARPGNKTEALDQDFFSGNHLNTAQGGLDAPRRRGVWVVRTQDRHPVQGIDEH